MSAASDARARLKQIIDTAFAAEGVQAENDRIHDSLGHQGIRVGITTERIDTLPGNAAVQTIELYVRFWGYYDRMIDPEQAVDPAVIESYAERFQKACEANIGGGTDKVWYFNVIMIDFLDDPTGNKTRFIATVTAYGNNPSLIETV